MRKRVTLMVVAVSAIFGICWCSGSVIYVLSFMSSTSLDFGAVSLPISYTVILFSSVVNPFAYALLNQQFRKKMKIMISCVCFSSFTVQPAGEPQGIEVDENEV